MIVRSVESYSMFSIHSPYLLLLVCFILVFLIVWIRTFYIKYGGTGHRLDPSRVIRKYGNSLVILGLLVVSFLFLDLGVSYSVETAKDEYSLGEIACVNVSVHNPYPFPIWYSGFHSSAVELSPVSMERFPFGVAAIAADRASMEGGSIRQKSGFITAYGSKTLFSRMYETEVKGRIGVHAFIGSTRSYNISTNILVTEFKPVWVSVNSTGITLYADLDKEIDPPKVSLYVRNDNTYPVRLPVFDKLVYRYGSPDSNSSVGVYLDWVISHFDIPAMSEEKIFTTINTIATEETPIYYTLYGITVRYPP